MDNFYLSGIVLLILIFVAIVLIFKLKNKNNEKLSGDFDEEANFSKLKNLIKNKSINLVDVPSSKQRGIIESQKIKNKTIKNFLKKPIEWEHAISYDDDIYEVYADEHIQNNKADEEQQEKESLIQENFDKKLTILVVDDSITISKLIKDILNNANYDCTIKNNGKSALDYLTSSVVVPDLIITDFEMPIMTGIDFIKSIKKERKFKNIPILLIVSDPERYVYLLQDGLVNGIVKKPFDKNEFIGQVKYLIEG